MHPPSCSWRMREIGTWRKQRKLVKRWGTSRYVKSWAHMLRRSLRLTASLHCHAMSSRTYSTSMPSWGYVLPVSEYSANFVHFTHLAVQLPLAAHNRHRCRLHFCLVHARKHANLSDGAGRGLRDPDLCEVCAMWWFVFSRCAPVDAILARVRTQARTQEHVECTVPTLQNTIDEAVQRAQHLEAQLQQARDQSHRWGTRARLFLLPSPSYGQCCQQPTWGTCKRALGPNILAGQAAQACMWQGFKLDWCGWQEARSPCHGNLLHRAKPMCAALRRPATTSIFIAMFLDISLLHSRRCWPSVGVHAEDDRPPLFPLLTTLC